MTPLIRLKRFRGSFRSRLFLIFTAFTGIISAAFVFVLISGEIQNYKDRSTEKAQLLASLIASNITLDLYSENIAELSRHAAEMFSTPSVARVVITDNDSRRLVDVTAPTVTSGTPVVTSSAPVIVNTSSPSAESALSGIKSPVLAPLGSVSLSIDTADRNKSITAAVIKTSWMALLFWIAVVAACYPVLKRVTQSFDTLTEGLNIMMTGDYSRKIFIDKDDEAGRAAHTVNRLAATLEEREIENCTLQEKLVNAMRLEVQEERRNIMAKLIQTNRMTSLGLLISSIAHNINTPNGAIKLAAQYVANSWKDTLPILEHIAKEEGDFTIGGLPLGIAKVEIKGANESIINNANRVERVIQDLRTYNLGERNEHRPGVSVNLVVEEALTIIRAHGRQGEISITPTLSPNLPDITGNQYQLEQVVVNLILNAMQATPNNKGSVIVTTDFIAESAEVRISVTDHGEGITTSVRKHLFEPFYTTKINTGGSGLGLYISNFIVTEHKGLLTIESDNDATVATVHLPVVAKADLS